MRALVYAPGLWGWMKFSYDARSTVKAAYLPHANLYVLVITASQLVVGTELHDKPELGRITYKKEDAGYKVWGFGQGTSRKGLNPYWNNNEITSRQPSSITGMAPLHYDPLNDVAFLFSSEKELKSFANIMTSTFTKLKVM
jgi:hypothetical protein